MEVIEVEFLFMYIELTPDQLLNRSNMGICN